MLACTSPEAIGLSITLGYIALAFGLVAALIACVISVWHRSFVWLPFFAVLLALHPAWTIGVMGGDCGYTRRFLSVVVGLAFLALLAVQLVRPYFSLLRFLLVTLLVASVSYLPALASHALDDDSWLDARLFVYKFGYRFSSHQMTRIALALSSACVFSVLAAAVYARRKRSNQAMQRTAPYSDA
jgi:hypothetical protein